MSSLPQKPGGSRRSRITGSQSFKGVATLFEEGNDVVLSRNSGRGMVVGWVDDEKSQRWMKGTGGDAGKNGIIVGHKWVQSQSPSLSAADCCNHLHECEAVEASRDSFNSIQLSAYAYLVLV